MRRLKHKDVRPPAGLAGQVRPRRRSRGGQSSSSDQHLADFSLPPCDKSSSNRPALRDSFISCGSPPIRTVLNGRFRFLVHRPPRGVVHPGAEIKQNLFSNIIIPIGQVALKQPIVYS
ncbi:hypothetical protein ACOJQI_17030 [Bacillus salacetis]|uniref:hypothetical protein n=1 Tax=Bacillus salacetis TaxID=2315464 RepID=UPI003B9FA908